MKYQYRRQKKLKSNKEKLVKETSKLKKVLDINGEKWSIHRSPNGIRIKNTDGTVNEYITWDILLGHCRLVYATGKSM